MGIKTANGVLRHELYTVSQWKEAIQLIVNGKRCHGPMSVGITQHYTKTLAHTVDVIRERMNTDDVDTIYNSIFPEKSNKVESLESFLDEWGYIHNKEVRKLYEQKLSGIRK